MTLSQTPDSACLHCGVDLTHDPSGKKICNSCLATAGTSTEALEVSTSPAETIDSATAKNTAANDLQRSSRSIGDYEIIGEIARGGMGVVYKARHQTLGRLVALKLILSGQFASDNDVRRFHLEAESAAALDHPGIVSIYEIGEQDGHHFFAMKLIEGGSLAEKMPELRSDLRRFAGMVAEIAETIDYAHRRGILHRDLKPANILLDSSGRTLVTDLGLAKHMQADSELTGTGAIIGTPAYMPPEQATGSNQVTTAADIYSLGAILYEGLTGRPPHQADSAVATLMLAADGDVQSPSTLSPKVDRTLELISMKCLARVPDDRYASAGLLADDLTRWRAGESVSVRAKSFASICGELVSNQLRSAIGAMLIGTLGGLAIGIPVYSGLALKLFGNADAKFNVGRLHSVLPDVKLPDPWWLHPPEFLAQWAALPGALFCLTLGLLIRRTVKPQDIRQALAIGLVAGLLMTIVQYGMYGIAANWQTFALVNAEQIDRLAAAGFADPAARESAIDGIYHDFPGLASLPEDQRAKTLAQIVSTRQMLATPSVALSCLVVCLTFASIYCVAGTIHAFRLHNNSLPRLNRIIRYLEVMILLTIAGILGAVCVFAFGGMITTDTQAIPPSYRMLMPIGVAAATIPGWIQARWYVRYATYALVVALPILFS